MPTRRQVHALVTSQPFRCTRSLVVNFVKCLGVIIEEVNFLSLCHNSDNINIGVDAVIYSKCTISFKSALLNVADTDTELAMESLLLGHAV